MKLCYQCNVMNDKTRYAKATHRIYVGHTTDPSSFAANPNVCADVVSGGNLSTRYESHKHTS